MPTFQMHHRLTRAGIVLAVVCAGLSAPPAHAQQPAPSVPVPEAVAPDEPVEPAAAPQPPFDPPAQPGDMLLSSIFGPTRPAFVRQRLTRAPDMFGDLPGLAPTLTVGEALQTPGNFVTATADLPLAAGANRIKIAENNKALTTDRVYFNYNHFQNAYQAQAVQLGPGGAFALGRSFSLDRYTLGVEKTFFEGTWSAEVRVPFAGETGFRFAPDPLSPGVVTELSGGNFGNVSLILKNLLYADDHFAVAAGLGIEFPTGADPELRVASFQYRLANDTLYLHPFLAVLVDDGGSWFFNGFMQFDLPTSGNPLVSTNVSGNPALGTTSTLGVLRDQPLMHVDLGAGYWLFQDRCRGWLTGVAPVAELHYVTALRGTDRVAFASPTFVAPGDRVVDLASRRNRFDLLNLTLGLHVELDPNTLLRVGGAFPLRRGDDRLFQSELIVQFTRRF